MATEVLPDDRALRVGRRERALAQMEAHDLDVLVLGREANVRYVTGTPGLWTAGTRPFSPAAVVVRATGAIHALMTLHCCMGLETMRVSRSETKGETARPLHTAQEAGGRGSNIW